MNQKRVFFARKWAKRLFAAVLALCLAAHCSACQKMQPFELADGQNRGDAGGEDKSTGGGGKNAGGGAQKDAENSGDGKEGSGEGAVPVSYGKDLMEGTTARAVEGAEGKIEQDIKDTAVVADFAVRLFQQSMAEDQDSGDNTLISPMSVLFALAMTANGADKDTLQQMEQVFGLSVEELNRYLYAYRQTLPSGEKYKVSLANAIWFADGRNFLPDQDFLQKNADYYGADLYQEKFDDSTKQAINAWVKERTDGMIEEVVDRISDEAIMYLVNAVSFDAEWQSIYEQTQIHPGEFTTASGEKKEVEFMHSQEYAYLLDENAVGFLKYYADGKYAFAALLPDAGTSLEEYAAALTGERLQKILGNYTHTQVVASLPKFTTESSYTMNDILGKMGMGDAFDEILADFSKMGTVPEDYNISIGRVIHKAKIEVDERGTKAGAATVVEMKNMATAIQERIYVTLDRPFLYMIIDCETNLPLFIGAVQR